jgi:hypothetical protein
MPEITPAKETALPEAATPIAAIPAPPAVLEEPSAGGHYLRNPITGALSANPAFTTPSE